MSISNPLSNNDAVENIIKDDQPCSGFTIFPDVIIPSQKFGLTLQAEKSGTAKYPQFK